MTKRAKVIRKNVHVRKIALCPSKGAGGKHYFTLKLTSAWPYSEQGDLDL